jgi:hypothetical protein
MSFIVTSEFELQRVQPPALPFATPAYNEQYQNQLNNILRLYFNRLENILNQLDSGTFQPALTNYTVATLPSASTSGKGAKSFVTDALAPTFGATVVGGGAVAIPVYSDGTNWKVG